MSLVLVELHEVQLEPTVVLLLLLGIIYQTLEVVVVIRAFWRVYLDSFLLFLFLSLQYLISIHFPVVLFAI